MYADVSSLFYSRKALRQNKRYSQCAKHATRLIAVQGHVSIHFILKEAALLPSLNHLKKEADIFFNVFFLKKVYVNTLADR